jgi:hypothetical protein
VFIWLAWVIDKPPEKQVAPPIWLRLVFWVNIALLVLVFTNDLHNIVFSIDLNNPKWSSEYGYEIGYYLIQGCYYISIVTGIAMMVYKGWGSLKKRGLIMLPILLVLFIAYNAGYEAGIPVAVDSDVTMMTGVFSVLFLWTCIRVGLIPVNSKYTALFADSTLGMQIIDSAGLTALSSASSTQYHPDTFERARANSPLPIQEDENGLLFAAPVIGGYAMWQEDITELTHLHKEIEESVSKLKAANAMLAEEEKIRRSIQEEQAKTMLMAQLEAEISEHTIKLSKMVEQLESEDDQQKATARIALLLCYIKRRCNLFFLEKEAQDFPAGEFAAWLDELAEMAGYTGVRIIVTNKLKSQVKIRYATIFYDFFYNVICWADKADKKNILAYLDIEKEDLIFWLLPSEDASSFCMEESLLSAISRSGGKYMLKDLDDAEAISLSFPKGGEKPG